MKLEDIIAPLYWENWNGSDIWKAQGSGWEYDVRYDDGDYVLRADKYPGDVYFKCCEDIEDGKQKAWKHHLEQCRPLINPALLAVDQTNKERL